MTEPVALVDLKTHLRQDISSTGEDAYLSAMIVAARRACEAQINRSIVGAALVESLDAFPASTWWPFPVEIPDPRAREIVLAGGSVATVAIAYVDATGTTQTLDPASYVTDLADVPARLAPIGAWPVAKVMPGAVTITYTVSSLSADDTMVVRQAMLLLMGHWYRNRESVAVDVRGAPAELPQSVSWLLQPLRQWATE